MQLPLPFPAGQVKPHPALTANRRKELPTPAGGTGEAASRPHSDSAKGTIHPPPAGQAKPHPASTVIRRKEPSTPRRAGQAKPHPALHNVPPPSFIQENNMNQYKKWLLLFFAALITALLAITALVLTVDPFFQYHAPLPGYPYKVDNQLSQNPGMARHLDYDSVLLGSSMTASFDTDWFGEILNLNTVKLSYNGALPKDEANIMDIIFDAKQDTVKTIFMALDQNTLSAGTEETKFPIPEYLYDKNPFNNIQYVFNKDVLLNYILKPLADPTERTDWTQLYKPWWTDQYYTKANVLMYYTPAEEADEEMPEDLFLSGTAANLDQNICPYIEAHPETEFIFFYPPYSILYWNDVMRQKQLDAEIAELKYVTERLLSYDNVRMFCFQNQRDIVCDLNNYADYTHYHADVCRYIVECFASGECELTMENYEEVFADLAELASTYDYEAIYDNWYE